jgi:sugar lactone lactonase YvrE
MNKFTIIFFVIVLSMASVVYAQDEANWIFDSVLHDFEMEQSNSYGVHGVAVAPDGNIWIPVYGSLAQDTLFVGEDTINVRPIYVLDPEGNHVDFSPLRFIDFGGGQIDTLHADSPINGSGAGVSIANDGNILFTSWATLYKIDYTDGSGIAKFTDPATPKNYFTEGVQDENGNIYVGYVLSASKPVIMLDQNLNFVANAVDTLGHINRTLAVSPDGKDLYAGSTWNGFGIEHWRSELPGILKHTAIDTFGNWPEVTVEREGLPDTTYLNVKLWASCLDWDPNGLLVAGNLWDDWSSGGAGTGSHFYWFDVTTKEQKWKVGTPEPVPAAEGGMWSPRGAAWSADGNTMYLADWDYNAITVWTKNPASIEQDGEIIARTFNLSQNYPNPFNPVTTIPFALYKRVEVELKVFDVQGRLVDTLIDGPMNAGNHNITYDANHLASGTYFYQLNVEGQILTKKMILVR